MEEVLAGMYLRIGAAAANNPNGLLKYRAQGIF